MRSRGLSKQCKPSQGKYQKRGERCYRRETASGKSAGYADDGYDYRAFARANIDQSIIGGYADFRRRLCFVDYSIERRRR